MEILEAYTNFFESRLQGRYITSEMIAPLLDGYKNEFDISVIGTSEQGRSIHQIKIGKGSKKVFAWSQMHGNESTTTKAIFDFLKFLSQKNQFQKNIHTFLDTYSLYIIPLLNPDGAYAYTRENANEVDLNRDAQMLSQSESTVLRKAFDTIAPDLCLNLHDQRTIYGFTTGKEATVSFLAPSASEDRNITPARLQAMQFIEKMAGVLSQYIPGHVGRYDDGFNANCVGDTFQMAHVPTILFEAGHYANDYQREKTRMYICFALLALFDFVTISEEKKMPYQTLPENRKNYFDIIIRNVGASGGKKNSDIAIQYRELLQASKIIWVPYIEQLGDLEMFFGHKEIDAKGAKILVNSQRKFNVGDKILKIVNKNDDSLLYINKN